MIQYRSSKELRQLFIDFWVSKGSHYYKSFPLVSDDPTVLFTIAGMVPFKKYYMGLEEPEYPSAVTSQKCIRTNDIFQVGKTARHHTFFEMLGNFSWGGYFKKESLVWGWEFLTEVIGLDPDKMYATIFNGDDEAFDVWTKDIGLAEDRVFRCPAKENFWYMGEDKGVCGPDSEILYDTNEENIDIDWHYKHNHDNYLELWNHVFTQYNKEAWDIYKPLPRKNIDTGMGLERLTSIVQGVRNDFETDLFMPIIKKIESIAGIKYGNYECEDLALKVIADHSRAIAFLIADGVLPSNKDRGYVVRKLIRRSMVYARKIGLEKPFLNDVIDVVIQEMSDPYTELKDNNSVIKQYVEKEEKSFGRTVERGMKLLNDEIKYVSTEEFDQRLLNGDVAFKLYDTYGFPLDLTKEICAEDGIVVDEDGFNIEMEKQRERSRSNGTGNRR